MRVSALDPLLVQLFLVELHPFLWVRIFTVDLSQMFRLLTAENQAKALKESQCTHSDFIYKEQICQIETVLIHVREIGSSICNLITFSQSLKEPDAITRCIDLLQHDTKEIDR